ncbi:MAG: ATPase [Nitrosomonadales bacterium]|nr:ATPase [Nitrosomonadales bacterium]
MRAKTIPAGFHQIQRHDGIFQESVHDAYQAKGKPLEPAICTQCGAVFHAGRWQWRNPPENGHRTVCPACHRIHDHYPAGLLTLEGEFFHAHHDEIMRLVRNHEKHERTEHPLQRIMDVEEKDGASLVTTTDIHLARGIGVALHHAYQGELEFHYNPAQNLLRVNWTH